jgi:hypothetical protein
MNNLKPIAAAIVIFAGAYLNVGAMQADASSGVLPVSHAVGLALIAIGLWLLFVTWAETKGTDRPLWLRFTIRDLLWLTLLVALVVAWWADRREMQARLDTAGVTPAPSAGAPGLGSGNFGGSGGIPTGGGS